MHRYKVEAWIPWEDGHVWDVPYEGRWLLPTIFHAARATRRGQIVVIRWRKQ